MKDKYLLHTEKDGERWISAPNNGGDIGDLQDIKDELNMLYDKNKAYGKIIEAYEKEIQSWKYVADMASGSNTPDELHNFIIACNL